MTLFFYFPFDGRHKGVHTTPIRNRIHSHSLSGQAGYSLRYWGWMISAIHEFQARQNYVIHVLLSNSSICSICNLHILSQWIASGQILGMLMDGLLTRVKEQASQCVLLSDVIVRLGDSSEDVDKQLENGRQTLKVKGWRLAKGKLNIHEPLMRQGNK